VPAATAAPAAAATATYKITDLGSLGLGESYGLAINASGEVTGYSYLTKEIQVPCYPGSPKTKKCFTHPCHAFVYRNGTMTDLGTLAGGFSQGVAINRFGEVVGQSFNNTSGSSFVWKGTTMTALPANLYAFGINDSGQIAGGCGHTCVDTGGTVTDLPDPSALLGCGASAINNTGQIAGGCADTSSNQHAVLWRNGTPTDLGALFGGASASATAINNLGQVAGWAQDSSGAVYGFLWSNGKVTNLRLEIPSAVNDHGVAVGANQIYRSGTLSNINNLIPAGSPYQIEDATAINDNGQIVANANDTVTNQTHALVLTPN
jgi:probable HAF family extracellular repeat protein